MSYSERGAVLYNRGEYVLAAQAFIDAINERIKLGEQPYVGDANRAGAALYALQDYSNASKFLNLARHIEPDNLFIARNLAQMKKKMGQYDEVLELITECLRKNPQDVIALDVLADTYHRMGSAESAKKAGIQSLRAKDRAVNLPAHLRTIQERIDYPWKLGSAEIPPLEKTVASRNIISYSLWGSKPEYCDGAVANARIAPVLFPAWRCRFYCDDSVPEKVIKELKAAGADVRAPTKNLSSYYGLFWRFAVIDDPDVDRFLIRDADSPLSPIERLCVDQWMRSDKPFHLIRDWYSHSELILAGLWGGVQGFLPPLEAAYDDFVARTDNERTVDQQFLRQYVWPLIRECHLAHDSYFGFHGAVPVPELYGQPEGGHVGQSWHGALGQWRGRFLDDPA